MKRARPIHSLPLLVLLASPLLLGADLSTYRGFQLGMTLNAAVKHSGMEASEVTVIHERPARIQELSWRPARFSSSDTDPVEQVVFSFYEGQLFRMVIDYDSQKTNGLSVEDIVEAVSAQYGTATRSPVKTVLPSDVFSEGVTIMALWEDTGYSFTLVQSPYGSKFALIALSKRLDSLARTAIAAAIQMDAQEAPQRQKLQEQDAKAALQKTRLVNQGHFRP